MTILSTWREAVTHSSVSIQGSLSLQQRRGFGKSETWDCLMIPPHEGDSRAEQSCTYKYITISNILELLFQSFLCFPTHLDTLDFLIQNMPTVSTPHFCRWRHRFHFTFVWSYPRQLLSATLF